MKKEFSFYEFVALLVPSVIFLYCAQLIFADQGFEPIIDFNNLGQTLVFVIICYGTGNMLQALGTFYIDGIWLLYGGQPTKWLNKKNKFGKFLFIDEKLNTAIHSKVKEECEVEMEDYGRYIYSILLKQDQTKRTDTFNGTVFMFRGLAVSFFLIFVLCLCFCYWIFAIICFALFLLATNRMIRFAKYYAMQIFTDFYQA